MKEYAALVLRETDDAGYGVAVPDCPGVKAAGATVGEALRNGTQALRLWAEAEESAGRAVPPPREPDAVAADPSVAAELEHGAILVLLPMLADAGRSQRINITLDAGLLKAIDAAASARGLTRSAFLASAARDKIAE